MKKFSLASFLLLLAASGAASAPNPSYSTRLAKALRVASAAREMGRPLDCPIVLTDGDVIVAPNQPPVAHQSTVGIVNALCEVTLDIVGCGFAPTSVAINCDTNGDGVPELTIPLKNVTRINNLLIQATLARITPQLPGTAFPLACCGGSATITFSRTVSEGDDNIFGPFTQSQTCPIELGLRAPVVVSASPSSFACGVAQDLLIPGACFLQAGGVPNVTSVFAVERGNPANTVHATTFTIINGNLIDALFNFGGSSAGKTFLIFVSGPNGTSRNMSVLPEKAPSTCPTGNEQGVQITVTCAASATPAPGEGTTPPESAAVIGGCRLDRSETGTYSLVLTTSGVRDGSVVTIGGFRAKKTRFRDSVAGNLFTTIVLKGKVCRGLPGAVVVTSPTGTASVPFQCDASCVQ